MSNRRLLRLTVILAAWGAGWAWWASPGAAQSRTANQRELLLSVRTMANRARSQAPVPIELILTNTQRQVQRGNLELTLWAGRGVAARLALPDLALSPGENRRRLLLPELALTQESSAVTLEGWFQRSDARLDLGDNHDVVIPSYLVRNFVLLDVSENSVGTNQSHLALRDSLELQRFSPLRQSSDTGLNNLDPGGEPIASGASKSAGVVVNPSVMSPGDFPTTATLLTGVDLVLLSAEGLLGLKATQLRALTEWVQAGGSLCVQVPVGEPVAVANLQALNEWANSGAEGPRYLTLPGGSELSVVGPETGQPEGAAPPGTRPLDVRLAYLGWGRVALIERPSLDGDRLQGTEWLRCVGFLWRLNGLQLQTLLASHPNPRWETPPALKNALSAHEQKHGYRPDSSLGEDGMLTKTLEPQTVAALPVGRFLAVLCLFFLIVIPGDYYGLGTLRLRRWTWVFVPACALLFAWLISSMAEAVLGPKGFTHQIEICDLNQAGSQVRRTVLELKMVPSPRVDRKDFRDAVYVNLTNFSRAELMADQTHGSLGEPDVTGGDTPPVYEGVLPVAYAVAEPLRRWSPVLTRVTTLGPTQGRDLLDWRQVGGTRWESLTEVRKVFAETAPEAHLLHLTRSRIQTSAPSAATSDRDQRLIALVTALTCRIQVTSLNGSGTPEFISALPAADNWFAVVNQTSPSGSGSLEDLRLMQAMDPDEDCELLLVVIPGTEKTQVYRMLKAGTP